MELGQISRAEDEISVPYSCITDNCGRIYFILCSREIKLDSYN
jgi:hypothetical protein